jgi:hypothetical protein
MWKEYLSQAEGADVWVAFRFTNPKRAQLTPALRTTVNDTEHICTDFLSKVSAFQVLFPEPPPAPPSRNTRCHPELPWQTFTPAKIR